MLGVVWLGAGSIAHAAEARPWLCRVKPVFSSSKPVRYEARSRGSHRWRLFFMQFVAGGPHDGFAVTGARDLPRGGSSIGELGAGQFFTIALYLGPGGHWVCPGSAGEAEEPRGSGVISDLCYDAESADSCQVRLTIQRAAGGPVSKH